MFFPGHDTIEMKTPGAVRILHRHKQTARSSCDPPPLATELCTPPRTPGSQARQKFRVLRMLWKQPKRIWTGLTRSSKSAGSSSEAQAKTHITANAVSNERGKRPEGSRDQHRLWGSDLGGQGRFVRPGPNSPWAPPGCWHKGASWQRGQLDRAGSRLRAEMHRMADYYPTQRELEQHAFR